jgi:hypothetical protein
MHMKMRTDRFLMLAQHLRCGDTFNSLVVDVGDGSLKNKAGLACMAIGNSSQILMTAHFEKSFFEEIVGEISFVWDSEKMVKYAGMMKEEDHVMVTIDNASIILESFDKEGNRVERIVMPSKPKEAARNILEAFPSKMGEPDDSKYPDIPAITVKRGRYDARIKVSSEILQKIVKRALEFNQFHFPVTFKDGKLNIQSGAHLDRSADSYDRNIELLDSELWNEKSAIEIKCGPSFLKVLQVVHGDVFMDLGDDTPVWLTTRDYLQIEEKEEDKVVTKQGDKIYQAHYFVVPRIYQEKEVKGAEPEEAEAVEELSI